MQTPRLYIFETGISPAQSVERLGKVVMAASLVVGVSYMGAGYMEDRFADDARESVTVAEQTHASPDVVDGLEAQVEKYEAQAAELYDTGNKRALGAVLAGVITIGAQVAQRRKKPTLGKW